MLSTLLCCAAPAPPGGQRHPAPPSSPPAPAKLCWPLAAAARRPSRWPRVLRSHGRPSEPVWRPCGHPQRRPWPAPNTGTGPARTNLPCRYSPLSTRQTRRHASEGVNDRCGVGRILRCWAKREPDKTPRECHESRRGVCACACPHARVRERDRRRVHVSPPVAKKDVEEEECGATGSARVRRHCLYNPGYRHPRGAAPAASLAHSPLPMYSMIAAACAGVWSCVMRAAV
jgi:hypothetical protein